MTYLDDSPGSEIPLSAFVLTADLTMGRRWVRAQAADRRNVRPPLRRFRISVSTSRTEGLIGERMTATDGHGARLSRDLAARPGDPQPHDREALHARAREQRGTLATAGRSSSNRTSPAARPRTSSSSARRSEDRIWWGDVNKPFSEQNFVGFAKGRRASGRAPAVRRRPFRRREPRQRVGVRVITASPYHALFAKTMFIVPSARRARHVRGRRARAPRAGLEADPQEDGTRRGTFVVLHPARTRGTDRRHVVRGRDQEVDLHA